MNFGAFIRGISDRAGRSLASLGAGLDGLVGTVLPNIDTYLWRTRLRRWWRNRTSFLFGDFWNDADEFHYYIESPADPRQLRDVLRDDPLVYPFRLPFARLLAVLDTDAGQNLAVRLHFTVTAPGPLPGRLVLWFYRRRIEARLHDLANHLLFRCLATELVPAGLDATLIEITDFPSLDRSNFLQPGAVLRQSKHRWLSRLDAPVEYPARDYFAHYLAQPGYPERIELAEVLIVPLELPAAELASLIPPPFHAGARPVLLLVIARELGQRKKSGTSRRPAIRWEVRAPVELITRSNHLFGWLPLEACRLPLDRPPLPFDDLSASLRRTPEGLRFCAGGGRGRLRYHCVFRPRGGLHEGDGLPEVLTGEQLLFIQNPESLDITVLQESPDFAVNRIQHALNETATYEHHQGTPKLPDPARYYGARWDLSPALPVEGIYLPQLGLDISCAREIRLTDAQYRSRPVRTGEPVAPR